MNGHEEKLLIEQARNAVVGFLQREGETRSRDVLLGLLEGPTSREHPNLGKLYIFQGELGEFWVSRDRGNVVTYMAPKRMTAREAQAYIQDFLGRHIPDFGQRHFVRVEAVQVGPLWKEEWIERPRSPSEVSIFENWITIHVNLEGRRVHYFNASDLRRVRMESPRIDEARARQMIQSRFPEGKILELGLIEHTEDGGRHWRTLWHAVVTPDLEIETPRTLYSIDADTGEVVP